MSADLEKWGLISNVWTARAWCSILFAITAMAHINVVSCNRAYKSYHSFDAILRFLFLEVTLVSYFIEDDAKQNIALLPGKTVF